MKEGDIPFFMYYHSFHQPLPKYFSIVLKSCLNTPLLKIVGAQPSQWEKRIWICWLEIFLEISSSVVLPDTIYCNLPNAILMPASFILPPPVLQYWPSFSPLRLAVVGGGRKKRRKPEVSEARAARIDASTGSQHIEISCLNTGCRFLVKKCISGSIKLL